ncbi:MAG: hypothetical protein AB7S52_00155 [Sphaerochaetaceae bacterium]
MNRRAALIWLVFLCAIPLFAEMAPTAYRDMQSGAPDHVEISVERVKVRWILFTRTSNVTVHAKITEVYSSLSNLSVGDSITITYQHYKSPSRGWTGPRDIPILKKREITEAFLAFDRETNTYVPAARGASFEPLVPIR